MQARKSSASQGASPRTGARFLPDFCSAPAVIEILVIAELVAMILTMAHGLAPGTDVLNDFIGMSLFMLWLALFSAAALCMAKRWIENVSQRQAYLTCYALLLTVTAVVSLAALWLNDWLGLELVRGNYTFIGRNLSVSAIVSAIALRYFHVQFQWQQQVERQAAARIEALQARIRPHFLFNSMNTIAALISVAPDDAEQAVEDLSELFRASLVDAGKLASFAEELELARHYERLERNRLGERLRVDWDIEQVPEETPIPRLTLQPLLENAIHHGIEKLPEGGRIEVQAILDEKHVEIMIRNPLPDSDITTRRGFQIALDNTRERLALALGHRARLEAGPQDGYFEARVILPRTTT